VAIDGDSLDLLFDTGATITLSDSALAALGDRGPPARGTSFITQSVFTRWRQWHPDWRVIERADRVLDMPMILVPEVTIAGHTVGPAWFTMRPDRNFHQYMSQWMDRRIDGALGGSVLRYFRVTLDYPGAAAMFEVTPQASLEPQQPRQLPRRRPPCRHVARDRRHAAEHCDDRSERQRIAWPHAEEQTAEYSSQRERDGDPERQPERDRFQSLADDESPDVRRTRAERHADTHLATATRQRVGNDAVDADARRRERGQGEEREQRELEAAGSD
jgi:hypothetical protein